MEPFIGQIVLFAGNFAINQWALCNGAALPVAQYQPLFAILGTTYGGDGITTFNLPNLNGAVNAGTSDPQPVVNYLIALNGAFPTRS